MHLIEIKDKMTYLNAHDLRPVSDPVFLEATSIQLKNINRIIGGRALLNMAIVLKKRR
jgi:hypothetical protein